MDSADFYRIFWERTYDLFYYICNPFRRCEECLNLIEDLVIFMAKYGKFSSPAVALALDVIVQRAMYELSDKMYKNADRQGQTNADDEDLNNILNTPACSAKNIENCIAIMTQVVTPMILSIGDHFGVNSLTNPPCPLNERISTLNRQLQELVAWTSFLGQTTVPESFPKYPPPPPGAHEVDAGNNNPTVRILDESLRVLLKEMMVQGAVPYEVVEKVKLKINKILYQQVSRDIEVTYCGSMALGLVDCESKGELDFIAVAPPYHYNFYNLAPAGRAQETAAYKDVQREIRSIEETLEVDMLAESALKHLKACMKEFRSVVSDYVKKLNASLETSATATAMMPPPAHMMMAQRGQFPPQAPMPMRGAQYQQQQQQQQYMQQPYQQPPMAGGHSAAMEYSTTVGNGMYQTAMGGGSHSAAAGSSGPMFSADVMQLLSSITADVDMIRHLGDEVIDLHINIKQEALRTQPNMVVLSKRLEVLHDISEKPENEKNNNIRKALKAVEKSLKDFGCFYVRIQAHKTRFLHVKFNYQEHLKEQLSCNVILHNVLPIQGTDLLNAYINLDPTGKVREFLQTIKLFVKAHRICDASMGFLSTYAWYVMALHVLLRFEFLPNIHSEVIGRSDETLSATQTGIRSGCSEESDIAGEGGEDGAAVLREVSFMSPRRVLQLNSTYLRRLESTSIFELLDLFFRYFVQQFDVFNGVVTLRGRGDVMEKADWGKAAVLWRIHVEDPFDHVRSKSPYDLGSTLSRPGQLTTFKALRRAIYGIHSIVAIGIDSCRSNIKKLFSRTELIHLARRSDYLGAIINDPPRWTHSNINTDKWQKSLHELKSVSDNMMLHISKTSSEDPHEAASKGRGIMNEHVHGPPPPVDMKLVSASYHSPGVAMVDSPPPGTGLYRPGESFQPFPQSSSPVPPGAMPPQHHRVVPKLQQLHEFAPPISYHTHGAPVAGSMDFSPRRSTAPSTGRSSGSQDSARERDAQQQQELLNYQRSEQNAKQIQSLLSPRVDLYPAATAGQQQHGGEYMDLSRLSAANQAAMYSQSAPVTARPVHPSQILGPPQLINTNASPINYFSKPQAGFDNRAVHGQEQLDYINKQLSMTSRYSGGSARGSQIYEENKAVINATMAPPRFAGPGVPALPIGRTPPYDGVPAPFGSPTHHMVTPRTLASGLSTAINTARSVNTPRYDMQGQLVEHPNRYYRSPKAADSARRNTEEDFAAATAQQQMFQQAQDSNAGGNSRPTSQHYGSAHGNGSSLRVDAASFVPQYHAQPPLQPPFSGRMSYTPPPQQDYGVFSSESAEDSAKKGRRAPPVVPMIPLSGIRRDDMPIPVESSGDSFDLSNLATQYPLSGEPTPYSKPGGGMSFAPLHSGSGPMVSSEMDSSGMFEGSLNNFRPSSLTESQSGSFYYQRPASDRQQEDLKFLMSQLNTDSVEMPLTGRSDMPLTARSDMPLTARSDMPLTARSASSAMTGLSMHTSTTSGLSSNKDGYISTHTSLPSTGRGSIPTSGRSMTSTTPRGLMSGVGKGAVLNSSGMGASSAPISSFNEVPSLLFCDEASDESLYQLASNMRLSYGVGGPVGMSAQMTADPHSSISGGVADMNASFYSPAPPPALYTIPGDSSRNSGRVSSGATMEIQQQSLLLTGANTSSPRD